MIVRSAVVRERVTVGEPSVTGHSQVGERSSAEATSGARTFRLQ